ncbi:glycerophosphodiester phosphodiesterase [Streptomyces sp. NPDC057580]|uniref:glycerophosphodiester phosphodiesterase n=1 Tax=Streptomyces sp. NPDC057580 TaxID=3346173 RepID=UPI0036B50685
MPFPDGVPTTLVQYTAASPVGGGPAAGTVEFALTVDAVALAGDNVVFTGGGVYALDDQGRLVDGAQVGVRLLPNNVPGANPTASAWLATERITGAPTRSYYIQLSVDQPTADLAAIQQVDPDRAQYVAVVGPPGPPGSIADAEAYTDTAVSAATMAAAADATAKAGAAQTAAIAAAAADATAKADSARTTAISTAATDATTKAGNAQTAATAAAATDAAAKYEPNAAVTITNLLSTNPAYFGHRGQGMVSPEHTMAAYRGAVAAGTKAIEVSVNVAADGTLVCIHDTTLDRTTYSTGAVNTWTWAELKNRVLTNGRVMQGQGWTDQPIPTLREVLDEFLGRVVIFLEAKGNDAVVPLQTMLSTFYPTANKSVVWKAHVGTLSLPWAKMNGFKTWVYVDDGTTDAAMDAKDANVDYWGVQTTMADARVTQVVARGKPVFSWPVYRRSQRDRLSGLGVVGMMTSDIQYLSRSTPMRTASNWATQVKEAGGVPTLDYDSTYALKWDDAPNVGWVYINSAGQSYGLGTYCPIVGGAGGYRISFDMRFEGIPTLTTEHAGIYFGKTSDDAYRFGTANASGGYHMVMRANGQMQLNRHAAGVTTGTALGTAQNTTAVVADNPMSFQLDVTPGTIELRRTDSTGWTTGPIADTTYRGGYFGLSNGGITNLATKPHWRNLVITQL